MARRELHLYDITSTCCYTTDITVLCIYIKNRPVSIETCNWPVIRASCIVQYLAQIYIVCEEASARNPASVLKTLTLRRRRLFSSLRPWQEAGETLQMLFYSRQENTTLLVHSTYFWNSNIKHLAIYSMYTYYITETLVTYWTTHPCLCLDWAFRLSPVSRQSIGQPGGEIIISLASVACQIR